MTTNRLFIFIILLIILIPVEGISDCVEGDCWNGKGTYVLPDGSKYTGDFRGGFPDGYGTGTYPDGSKYSGEWMDGSHHGKGTYIWFDGSKYVGEWKEGKIYGHGIITYSDGSKYEGELSDGERHGKGTYTYIDGKAIGGIWENDKLVEERYDISEALKYKLYVNVEPPDSIIKIMNIKSKFKQGIKLSAGKYILQIEKNGYETKRDTVYIKDSDIRVSYKLTRSSGCISGNCLNGKGTYVSDKGLKYVGEFKNGKPHGKGTLILSTGEKYVGEWKDGKPYANSYGKRNAHSTIEDGSIFGAVISYTIVPILLLACAILARIFSHKPKRVTTTARTKSETEFETQNVLEKKIKPKTAGKIDRKVYVQELSELKIKILRLKELSDNKFIEKNNYNRKVFELVVESVKDDLSENEVKLYLEKIYELKGDGLIDSNMHDNLAIRIQNRPTVIIKNKQSDIKEEQIDGLRCNKCGWEDIEFDSYFEEYSCNNCGWSFA